MIREARVEDADGMAEVVVASWQTAFDGIIDPEFPGKLYPAKYAAIFRENIETGREQMFVCEEAGTIRGFAGGKAGAQGRYDGEVAGLYVAPEAQSGGRGAELLRAIFRHLAQNKCRRIIAWTLDGAKNNSFYLRMGGEAAEHKTLKVGGREYPGVGFAFDLEKTADALRAENG